MSSPLESLPADIYKALEGRNIFDPDVADRFGDSLKELLLKRLRQKEERVPTLRMSNIGRPLRQLFYEINKYPGEKIEGKTLLKFAYGDLIEALVIALCEAAGYRVDDYQREIEVDGIKGHIDLVLNGVLVDVKSCSAYSFKKFKDGTLLEDGQDPFGYCHQICGYAHALNLPAAWIAVDKVSGEVCILELPQEKIDDYDVRRRIEVCKSAVSQSEPPERCYPDEPDGVSGNRKLGLSCSYCSWKSGCWSDSNDGKGLRIFQYSRGPVFLTSVTKEPKVFELTNKKEQQ